MPQSMIVCGIVRSRRPMTELKPLLFLFLGTTALLGAAELQSSRSPASSMPSAPAAVHFETTCDQAVAQTFDWAVAALHSFWFSEATVGFKRVLARDPQCAMAHWGLAMTDWGMRTQPGAVATGAAEIARGEALLPPNRADREASYIRAAARLFDDYARVGARSRILAYVGAMETLTAKYPDDVEAV